MPTATPQLHTPWRGYDRELRSARLDAAANVPGVASLAVVNEFARQMQSCAPTARWCVVGSHAIEAHLLASRWPINISRISPGIVVISGSLPPVGVAATPPSDLIGSSGYRFAIVSSAGGIPASYEVIWVTRRHAGKAQRLYDSILATCDARRIYGAAAFPIPTVEQLLALMLTTPHRSWTLKDSTDIRLLWHFARPSTMALRADLAAVVGHIHGEIDRNLALLASIVPGMVS